MPRMRAVQSSCLSLIGYAPARRELHVRFLESGEDYVYLGVEEAEYEELLRAESKGGYFNQVIKPRHSYRKLEKR